MEELLDWVMENTYGQIIVSKYKWGGSYTAYSIKYQASIFNRCTQIISHVGNISLGNDMDLDVACKQALVKLKSGHLDKLGGDVINGKIGCRYVDGNEFTELKFGDLV